MRSSTAVQEGPLLVSKWIDCPLLIEPEQMSALFQELGDVSLFQIDRVAAQGFVQVKEFLDNYSAVISLLREGVKPESLFFPMAMTCDEEALYRIPINDKEIIKCRLPVIRVQPHRFHYSAHDQSFHSMVFGQESIFWGVHFSYPQIYQDPKSHEVRKIDGEPPFSNTSLFKQLQKWVRYHTIPTPYCVGGKRVNVPMRIGKECLKWINRHPQLAAWGISVYES